MSRVGLGVIASSGGAQIRVDLDEVGVEARADAIGHERGVEREADVLEGVEHPGALEVREVGQRAAEEVGRQGPGIELEGGGVGPARPGIGDEAGGEGGGPSAVALT